MDRGVQLEPVSLWYLVEVLLRPEMLSWKDMEVLPETTIVDDSLKHTPFVRLATLDGILRWRQEPERWRHLVLEVKRTANRAAPRPCHMLQIAMQCEVSGCDAGLLFYMNDSETESGCGGYCLWLYRATPTAQRYLREVEKEAATFLEKIRTTPLSEKLRFANGYRQRQLQRLEQCLQPAFTLLRSVCGQVFQQISPTLFRIDTA